MKKTSITCKICGKIVEKRKSEIDRQKKKGRKDFYCGRECSGKNSKNIEHLEKYQNHFKENKYIRQPDKYSNFRWYIKNIRSRKNQQSNIDCQYLKELWEQQNGICPITKKKLELRTHSYKNKSQPYSASLDRIDNTKGYIKGNIRFVALIFNYARNTFSDNEVIDFCKAVIEYN